MKRLISTICIFFLTISVWSANHYIRDGASGDGSNWTNAWDDLPATFTRGDTYYVADGAYGTHYFNTATSSALIITIKKAIETDHGTETGWDSAYGDGQATFSGATSGSYVWRVGTSYWTFDGAVGGGPTSWESGHGFKLSAVSSYYEYMVMFTTSGVSNVILSHIEMGNTAAPGPGCDRAIYSTQGANNVTIQYCYIHYIGDVGMTILNSDGWVLEYCRLHQLDESGDVSADCGGGTSHGAGIELSAVTDDFTIRYNYMTDCCGSGWIGIYDTGSGDVNGLYIYGNIFACTSGFAESWGNGVVYTVSGINGPVENVRIYNNTFVDLCDPSLILLHIDTSGNEFKNNIVYNTTGTPSYTAFTRDYNASDEAISGDSNLQTLSADPFKDRAASNYHLSENTNAGTTLGSPYNTDMDGVGRGSGGVWDRGAYEYVPGYGDLKVMVTLSMFFAVLLQGFTVLMWLFVAMASIKAGRIATRWFWK